MRLEERITTGGAVYVVDLNLERQESALSLQLAIDPELGRVVRVVRFDGITGYRRVWFEPEDPDLMEGLIGVNEYEHPQGVQYLLTLEQSEIHFVTALEPSIEER